MKHEVASQAMAHLELGKVTRCAPFVKKTFKSHVMSTGECLWSTKPQCDINIPLPYPETLGPSERGDREIIRARS